MRIESCLAVDDKHCQLKKEPCGKDINVPATDAISRSELLKVIDTWDKFGCDADTKLVPYQDHYIPYIHYDDVVKCIKGMPPVTIKNKEEKRMSDLIKRNDALKPYEGLRDDDLISVKTIRDNLEHVPEVDFDEEGKCSTCKHDFDEVCEGCEWDSDNEMNTKWEPRVLDGK